MQTSQSSCNEVTVNFLIYMKFYKFDLLHNFEFNPTNGLTWSKVWHKMLVDLIPWIIILLNNFDISWLLNVNTVKLVWWVIFLKVNLMSYYHEQSTNPFFFLNLENFRLHGHLTSRYKDEANKRLTFNVVFRCLKYLFNYFELIVEIMILIYTNHKI